MTYRDYSTNKFDRIIVKFGIVYSPFVLKIGFCETRIRKYEIHLSIITIVRVRGMEYFILFSIHRSLRQIVSYNFIKIIVHTIVQVYHSVGDSSRERERERCIPDAQLRRPDVPVHLFERQNFIKTHINCNSSR